MNKITPADTGQRRLQWSWVQIEHPDMIDVNAQSAKEQGVQWNVQSGMFAFHNAQATENTSATKMMTLMDEFSDEANKHFGPHFISSLQSALGVTLVTDGDTLARLQKDKTKRSDGLLKVLEKLELLDGL